MTKYTFLFICFLIAMCSAVFAYWSPSPGVAARYWVVLNGGTSEDEKNIYLEGDVIQVWTGSQPEVGWCYNETNQTIAAAFFNARDAVSGSTTGGVYRYIAYSNGATTIYVTGTQTGITASVSGSTCTMSIPSNVIIQSLAINLPSGNGSYLTIEGLDGSSWVDRKGAVATICSQATGSETDFTKVKMPPADMDKIQILGINPTYDTRVNVSFQ